MKRYRKIKLINNKINDLEKNSKVKTKTGYLKRLIGEINKQLTEMRKKEKQRKKSTQNEKKTELQI